MRIELSSEALYERYKEIRENLPLFYCHEPIRFGTTVGGVYLNGKIEKGMYRCENINDKYVRVYDTFVGILINNDTFVEHFNAPSKLRLFLYKHHL